MSGIPLDDALVSALEKAGLKRQAFRLQVNELVELDSQDAAWSKLTAAEVVDGWVSTTGEVRRFHAAGRIEAWSEVPLTAELRLSETRSAHLRHRGGGWWWTVLERVDDDLGIGRTVDYLVEGDPGRTVRYEVGYGLVSGSDGAVVLRPVLSRFAGFQRSAGEEVVR